MTVSSRVIPDAYEDSVKLLRVASDAAERFGLDESLAVMATDENRAMVLDAGLAEPGDLEGLGPNDLLLAVEAADRDAADRAIEAMAEAVRGERSRPADDGEPGAQPPRSIARALDGLPDANLALISVPGEYAAREAWKALRAGLNVHLFSDDVALEAERALKAFGYDAGLLVMGPDCGTAIVDGTPLGFANAVERGDVGVVAAAGTGLMEVTSLLDRGGAGVSQAIGTGGRDLSAVVGGLAMRQGLDRLEADDDTAVVVLVSKPPDPEAAGDLLDAVETCQKPVVVSFVGGDPAEVEAAGAIPAPTLADAARAALDARPGADDGAASFADGVGIFTDSGSAAAVADDLGAPEQGRTQVRGLFTGGTLAGEATVLLEPVLGTVGSNVGTGGALADPHAPSDHAVIDLGDEAFTRGRPHPMLDPSLRTERLRTAIADPSVLVVLLDIELGYGAHDDPAGPIVEAVADAGTDGWPAVVASVCGTRGDPQDWPDQVTRLAEAGVHVAETNADAASLAGELWRAVRGPGGVR